MNGYPEHEKLRAISDKSQAIGEFLEWLETGGLDSPKAQPPLVVPVGSDPH